MRLVVFVVVLVLAVATHTVRAQEVPGRTGGVWVDSLDARSGPLWSLRPFIVPGTLTVRVDGVPLDSTDYTIDYRNGRLSLSGVGSGSLLTIVATYRVYPFHFRDTYGRQVLDTTGGPGERPDAVPGPDEVGASPSADPFGSRGLTRSGSITRGVIAGSNRDVSVESGLRLQLSGEVVEGVTVRAALSDENTPIQPEGTTQRLSEFDRVFIEIAGRQARAQLGDFDLVLPETQFARLNRKLQGVMVAAETAPGQLVPGGAGRTVVAGAVSRGLYREQIIRALDGVQGPYRLEGNAGERFIIVLAGSEAVYLDGIRLERGESNDYVIDYQTGEITFMPRRLITRERRIRVEFQYTTGEFSRTLVAVDSRVSAWQDAAGRPRMVLGASVQREADGQAFNTQIGLSGTDSLLLAAAGDRPAFRSGAEVVTYDPEAPYAQYLLRDTLSTGGRRDTIFVPISGVPEPGEVVYRVRFSRTERGQGSYVRGGQSVNGIQYRWVGEGLGEYEPVRQLRAPVDHRLADFRMAVTPVNGVEVFGEWARSVRDANRLSALDQANDAGDAYHAGVRVELPALMLGSLDLGRISGAIWQRYVASTFAPFERIRPVEFERRWNLASEADSLLVPVERSGRERIEEGFLEWTLPGRLRLRGETGKIALGGAFGGTRYAGTLQLTPDRLPRLEYNVEWVDSRDSLTAQRGQWLRQIGAVQWSLPGFSLTPRLEVEHEDRRQRATATERLTTSSFAFVEIRPGLTWTRNRLDAGVELEWRDERNALDGAMRAAGQAWTLQSRLDYRPRPSFNTEATAAYRVRQVREAFVGRDEAGQNEAVALRWNSRWAPWRRALESTFVYEALSERTPTLQELYVRTNPEYPEARYVWQDYNADGVVQIDEFLPEQTPNEGTYAQLFVPSDSLASTIGVQARLRFQIDPARWWQEGATGWRGLLTNLSSRTTFEVQEKSRDPEITRIYLLDLSRFRNPHHTMNGRLRLGQEVYLFRNSPRYGMNVSFGQVRTLAKLAAGEERRFINTWQWEGRYRPVEPWSLRLNATHEQNRNESARFASRRYDIVSLSVGPEATYTPSNRLGWTFGLWYADKVEREGERHARVVRVPTEVRLARAGRVQVTARAEVSHVTLDGEAEGLSAYELTEGRGVGTGYLWSLIGQYTINRYLRASLTYDGRAPEGVTPVHTVRMQVSAVF